MPFIHIRSLPFDPPLDISAVVETLSRDFASATGTDLEHVTVTWQTLEPGHYAVAGVSTHQQPRDSHPVLVEVLAPDFNSTQSVERMLIETANSISRLSGITLDNVFINYREAHSGQVFDGGEIVRW